MLFNSNIRLCAIAAAGLFFVKDVVALDCIRGGTSNTTAVRKTYPVPPIAIYTLTGDFKSTAWGDLYSFNYSGLTHPPTPPNSSALTPPNATRTLIFNNFKFDEQLLYINDTGPVNEFELRWNLTNPPVSKSYDSLIIDGYVQDFKVSQACDGQASLLEWTIEYCSSNQEQGWVLFQNTTIMEANALALTLNITGAADGTWDVGCALPTTTSATNMPTSTDGPIATTTDATFTKHSQSKAGAMETAMPRYGGALALAFAAAIVL